MYDTSVPNTFNILSASGSHAGCVQRSTSVPLAEEADDGRLLTVSGGVLQADGTSVSAGGYCTKLLRDNRVIER